MERAAVLVHLCPSSLQKNDVGRHDYKEEFKAQGIVKKAIALTSLLF